VFLPLGAAAIVHSEVEHGTGHRVIKRSGHVERAGPPLRRAAPQPSLQPAKIGKVTRVCAVGGPGELEEDQVDPRSKRKSPGPTSLKNQTDPLIRCAARADRRERAAYLHSENTDGL
jgi:hypothetical protein